MQRSFPALAAVFLLTACEAELAAPDQVSSCIEDLQIHARRGDPGAQTTLGVAYYKGMGVLPNSAKAVSLWQQAAEQDYPNAEAILGGAYYLGAGGLKKDEPHALELLHKAATGGSEIARQELHAIEATGTLPAFPPPPAMSPLP